MLCLIEVLVCVGADSHPLNARCLPHPMHSNGELSSFGDIAKQFEQMRINSERKHVAEPQEVEWRPEFLQRIGAPFFSALMLESCSFLLLLLLIVLVLLLLQGSFPCVILQHEETNR